MDANPTSREKLADDLARDAEEVRETHISWVFMHRDRVFKVKKPVSLGFLDFSTLAARSAACDAELRLNRRLAERVYLGKVPVTRNAEGMHALAGSGEIVDWAVEMLRLKDDDAADRRLARGDFGIDEIRLLARRLARFHAQTRCDEQTSQYGTAQAIGRNVDENFEQTRETVTAYLRAPEAQAVERFQHQFVQSNGELFEHRIAAERVRDGHGDLRLEHVYLSRDGQLDIIDCIEFNDRYRYADICADLAFLTMDLKWHDRTDLAGILLAAYALESNDYDLYGLIDFYECYRAYVRGKVSSLRAEDPTAPAALRDKARAEARKYYLLAEACLREPTVRPMLLVVAGSIASGKSAVARGLSERLDAAVVEADRTRKYLAGVEATTPLGGAAFSADYSADATAIVYAEILRRAKVVLASRRTVILDASFRSVRHREAARELAAAVGVPILLVECRASLETCRRRLQERAKGANTSDGRLEILDAFRANYEPIDEFAADEHLVIDTESPLEANLDVITQRL